MPTTTTKAPNDRARIASLLSQIKDGDRRRREEELLAVVRELRDVAAESERNRKLIAAVPGAVDALIDVFLSISVGSSSSSLFSLLPEEEEDATTSSNAAADRAVQAAALEILASLQLAEDRQSLLLLGRVMEEKEREILVVSCLQLQGSSSSCRGEREHAAQLLADVTAAMSPTRLASLPEQLFREVVHLLRDKQQEQVNSKPALHVLVNTTPWGRNRVKAVDAGAVAVLIDMLLALDAAADRRVTEMALAALDRLCSCAEGRADLLAHAAGVAVLAKHAAATPGTKHAVDRAVRVLRSVAKHAATPAVLQEMAQTGAVAALCLVAAQSPDGDRTGDRARETLRLHARAWRTSPCLHQHLRAIYPTPCPF